MWGGGAGRTGEVTDRLEAKGGCGQGGGHGELILNAGGPHPGTGRAPLLQGGRRASPGPRGLLVGTLTGGRKKEKGVQRGRGSQLRKPRCAWGRGEESESGELPSPAPFPCRLLADLGSLFTAWVSRGPSVGVQMAAGGEPSLECPVSPWPGLVLNDPALPTLLVTPPSGWVVYRDHLGRGAHSLLPPAPPAAQPGSYLPRPAAPTGQAASTWAQAFIAELRGRPGRQIFDDCIVIADWANRARLL